MKKYTQYNPIVGKYSAAIAAIVDEKMESLAQPIVTLGPKQEWIDRLHDAICDAIKEDTDIKHELERYFYEKQYKDIAHKKLVCIFSDDNVCTIESVSN